MGGCAVVLHHELFHPGEHIVADGLSAIAVVPVHGADAIQLLHAEHRAQVCRDLLQGLVVLLVDDQEGHRLHPEVLRQWRQYQGEEAHTRWHCWSWHMLLKDPVVLAEGDSVSSLGCC